MAWMDDGIVFDPASVTIEPIRKEAGYELHAIALLFMVSSRLKDYFDLSVPLGHEVLDAGLLAEAIQTTIERRGMAAGRAAGRAHGRIRTGSVAAGALAGVPEEELASARANGRRRGRFRSARYP